MSWYRDNRWLGNFVIAFAGATLLAFLFLFHAKGGFAQASAQFNDAATERNRLEHLNPFPNEENFRKTQTALDNYGASLNKLKDELRAQTLPTTAAAPLLGQELAQVELLFGILIDARVDTIGAVKRTGPPAGATAPPT